MNVTDLKTSSIGGVFSLHVPAREKYNNTVVRCVLVIPGKDWNYSDPAVLRVQATLVTASGLQAEQTLVIGLLNAVNNLRNGSLGQVVHLTWDAPISLNITGVDPDIWYRVEITVNNNSFSIYDGINVTEFNFTMADYNDTSTSVVYEFRVTPINGAGAGITSAPVTGHFSGLPRSTTHEVVPTSDTATLLNMNDSRPTISSFTPTTAYDSPPSSVVVAVSVVAVSTLLVTAVAATIVVIVFVKTTAKKYKLKQEIELKPNQAYETVTRPQPATQVHTEPCPAYGFVAHTCH